MAARRETILRAARTCFARKGFVATTIADLSAEAGVSAGGIYTHFDNKHALAAAIGDETTARAENPVDLLAMFDALSCPQGEENARLDLNLWAESLKDDALRDMVTHALDTFRNRLSHALPKGRANAGWISLLEAIALGLEVQRALRRPQSSRLRAALKTLLEERP